MKKHKPIDTRSKFSSLPMDRDGGEDWNDYPDIFGLVLRDEIYPQSMKDDKYRTTIPQQEGMRCTTRYADSRR